MLVFFIFQFPRRREANISFLHEVGPYCLCKCFGKLQKLGDSMLFCTGGVGEVAVRCLGALSSETMEPPVGGESRAACTCNSLLTTVWLLWRRRPQNTFQNHRQGERHAWARTLCFRMMLKITGRIMPLTVLISSSSTSGFLRCGINKAYLIGSNYNLRQKKNKKKIPCILLFHAQKVPFFPFIIPLLFSSIITGRFIDTENNSHLTFLSLVPKWNIQNSGSKQTN